jgi:pimeloyl-ACP methyl ester carboxylesterase
MVQRARIHRAVMHAQSTAGRASRLLGLILLASLNCGSTRGADLLEALNASYKDRGLVSEHKIVVAGMSSPVHYLQAGPASSEKLVVLLHGMIFSADTWKVVGTLDSLADHGLRTIAIDAHRYSGDFGQEIVRQSMLSSFLKAIGWTHKVLVVAASAGGTVGAPFVLGAGPNVVAGYVSVSAVLAEDGAPGASTSSVPALLVWGEHDAPSSAKALAHKQTFPTHQQIVVPEAPHPAYLKEPKCFNALLVRFALSKPGVLECEGRLSGSELRVAAQWGKARAHGKEVALEL